MRHAIHWHTAAPLWKASLTDTVEPGRRFRAPALLRFKGDDFMRQLEGTLQRGAEELTRAVAQPETWREERAGWMSESELAQSDTLKLYQPAQFRFYIVATSLVCQTPGLPDKRIDAAEGETVSFVMRRLVAKPGSDLDPSDESTYDEYAWFGTQQHGAWKPVGQRDLPADGEERIPLAPLTFDEARAQKRRVLIGLVPVARRDAYEAGVGILAAPVSAKLLRADTFSSPTAGKIAQGVIAGLGQLSEPSMEQSGEGAVRTALAHLLLDLALVLEEHVKAVSDAIAAQTSAGLSASHAALYGELDRVAPTTARRWREVLAKVLEPASRNRIETGNEPEALRDALGVTVGTEQVRVLAAHLKHADGLANALNAALPDPRREAFAADVAGKITALAEPGKSNADAQDALLMLLLDLAEFLQAELPSVWTAVSDADPSGLSSPQRAVYDRLAAARLAAHDWRALLADADAHRLEIVAGRVTPGIFVIGDRMTAADIAEAAELAGPLSAAVDAALAAEPLPSKDAARAQLAAAGTAPPPPGLYRIRCIYERPRCAPLHPPLVSAPSMPFELASFFDPDAPVRPIRVQMPDVSLKALRRTPRGVTFAISKELREQVNRVRSTSLKNLADGNIAPGESFDFGLICSLSIPIITIVAMILLMIIVQLLNIVFWWLPYFILCLPRIGKRS